MVKVLKSLHLVNSMGDSSNKVLMVHMILLIVVTWCWVDESTPKTSLFIQKKKKKKTQLTTN